MIISVSVVAKKKLVLVYTCNLQVTRNKEKHVIKWYVGLLVLWKKVSVLQNPSHAQWLPIHAICPMQISKQQHIVLLIFPRLNDSSWSNYEKQDLTLGFISYPVKNNLTEIHWISPIFYSTGQDWYLVLPVNFGRYWQNFINKLLFLTNFVQILSDFHFETGWNSSIILVALLG